MSAALLGVVSPCAIPRGSILIESVYFQNASRVGGTALAAYPLVRLRTGVARRLEVVLDAPSQIAESAVGGGGLYPMTRFGYGVDYTITQTSRSAIALIAEVLPPTSRFAPTHTQSQYEIGLSSGLTVSQRLSVGLAAEGISSGRVGFERILPLLAVNSSYTMNRALRVAADLGTRLVSRNVVAQSFGDVAINQKLGHNVIYNVGVGTTFNPVANAKSHYLASGFSVRL